MVSKVHHGLFQVSPHRLQKYSDVASVIGEQQFRHITRRTPDSGFCLSLVSVLSVAWYGMPYSIIALFHPDGGGHGTPQFASALRFHPPFGLRCASISSSSMSCIIESSLFCLSSDTPLPSPPPYCSPWLFRSTQATIRPRTAFSFFSSL